MSRFTGEGDRDDAGAGDSGDRGHGGGGFGRETLTPTWRTTRPPAPSRGRRRESDPHAGAPRRACAAFVGRRAEHLRMRRSSWPSAIRPSAVDSSTRSRLRAADSRRWSTPRRPSARPSPSRRHRARRCRTSPMSDGGPRARQPERDDRARCRARAVRVGQPVRSSGEVLVGEGVLIGAGAVVLQAHHRRGRRAVHVVRDVLPRTIVRRTRPNRRTRMKVLITGGAGFIGSNLKQAPEPAGAGLVAADHRRPQHRVPTWTASRPTSSRRASRP